MKQVGEPSGLAAEMNSTQSMIDAKTPLNPIFHGNLFREYKRTRMIETIVRMLSDLEGGKLSRRQLAVSLAALAAGAYAVPGALAAPATGSRAFTINHVTVRVPDLHRTSQFYQEFFGMPLKQQSATVHILGVGDSFFGIEQGENQDCYCRSLRLRNRQLQRR